MALVITIDGVDRSADVVRNTFRTSNVLTTRVDTCTFQMRLQDPATKPREGQEVIVTEGGERIFGGRVAVPAEQEIVPGQLYYLVTCTDYTREGDKNLVVERYPSGWTRGAIARDIVTKYCPGFTATTANVPDGPVLGEVRFHYWRPSECFTRLCRETGGDWYWDYSKGLHLFTSEESFAPWDVTDDGTGEHPADLVIAPDIQDVATRVYVLGGEYYGNQIPQKFKGNGQTREFNLAYKPKSLTVTLNGAPQTTAVDDLINQPEDPDWTWNHQEKLLKRGPNRTTPTDSDLIEVAYLPLLPVRVVMDDAEAQETLGALMGNDGIFEATITDLSLDSKEAARAAAKAFLRGHANPLITGGYSTMRSGLRAGMRQRLRLAGRNVDMEVLIGEVTRVALSNDLWRYHVQFATHLMGIEDLIRQLMEAQKRVSIREDETLDIIIGLKSALPPSDAVTVTETTSFVGIVGVSSVGRCEVG